MASGKKIERFVVTAVSSLELIPKAELPRLLPDRVVSARCWYQPQQEEH